MDSESEALSIANKISLEDFQFIEDCSLEKSNKTEMKDKNFSTDINPLDTCQLITKPRIRKCTACQQIINTVCYLSWELMDFCNESCLSKVQPLSSKCLNCSRFIRVSTFGKHYIRIKNDFRQFCTKECLEHYKSVVKICSCCHEEIFRNYSMRTHFIGRTGTRCFFCSQGCFDAFNNILKNVLPVVPPGSQCSVCNQKKTITNILKNDGNYYFFCTKRCVVAYSFVNLQAGTEKCITCQSYFSQLYPDGQIVFYENVKLTFCSYNCRNIHTFLHNQLVPCIWCKNKRNNFGMIRKYSGNIFQNIDLCSLNCLRLYEASTINETNKCSQIENADKIQRVSDKLSVTSHVNLNQELNSETSNSLPNSRFIELNNTLSQINTSRKKNQRNVATMCFIPKANKCNLVKPNTVNKAVQTVLNKILLPVPFPIYVPTPMAMYSIPFPNAIPVPIPIPVPIFVPISEQLDADIIQTVENKMPNNPVEADILKIADAIADDNLNELCPASDKYNAPDTNHHLQYESKGTEINDYINASNIHMEHRIIADPQTKTKGNTKRGIKRYSNSLINEDGVYRKRSMPEENGKYKMHNKVNLNYILGVKAWEQWVTGKNNYHRQIDSTEIFKINLLHMLPNELNNALSLFIKEFRKPNGSEYAPDTLYYLCLGIQFYLDLSGRRDNIFFDQVYSGFNANLDNIACKFCALYSESAFIVTRIEEDHLWEAKQLGCYSPQILLNTLIFFNTKYYRCNYVTQHMSISFFRILKLQKKRTNSRYLKLRLYPKTTENGPICGGEQYENRENPFRCPVKIYEFYLSKCPESVKTNYGAFYLQPEKHCVSDSPLWYTTSPLPREILAGMINRVKMIKEINVALSAVN